MTYTRKHRQKRHQKCRSSAHCSWGTCRSDSRSPPSWQSSINYNRSMPEDLKLSLIGSSQLPPPLRGLHSPRVRKHCQIIFACYFRKSSVAVCLHSVSYTTFFFQHPHAGNPKIQTQDSWLSHLLLLWTP